MQLAKQHESTISTTCVSISTVTVHSSQHESTRRINTDSSMVTRITFNDEHFLYPCKWYATCLNKALYYTVIIYVARCFDLAIQPHIHPFFSQYSPDIAKESLPYVHHILIYLCPPSENDLSQTAPAGDCEEKNTDINNATKKCRKGVLIAAWAIGGQVYIGIYSSKIADTGCLELNQPLISWLAL